MHSGADPGSRTPRRALEALVPNARDPRKRKSRRDLHLGGLWVDGGRNLTGGSDAYPRTSRSHPSVWVLTIAATDCARLAGHVGGGSIRMCDGPLLTFRRRQGTSRKVRFMRMRGRLRAILHDVSFVCNYFRRFTSIVLPPWTSAARTS